MLQTCCRQKKDELFMKLFTLTTAMCEFALRTSSAEPNMIEEQLGPVGGSDRGFRDAHARKVGRIRTEHNTRSQ